jgi:hypothetical protein
MGKEDKDMGGVIIKISINNNKLIDHITIIITDH